MRLLASCLVSGSTKPLVPGISMIFSKNNKKMIIEASFLFSSSVSAILMKTFTFLIIAGFAIISTDAVGVYTYDCSIFSNCSLKCKRWCHWYHTAKNSLCNANPGPSSCRWNRQILTAKILKNSAQKLRAHHLAWSSKQINTITLKRYDKNLHLHLFVGGAGAWLAYPTKHQHLSPFNKICYITSEVKDN
jgi:hypothetical protein